VWHRGVWRQGRWPARVTSLSQFQFNLVKRIPSSLGPVSAPPKIAMNATAAAAARTASEVFYEHGLFCKGGLLSHVGLSAVGNSFLATWAAFTVTAVVAVFATSGPLFYHYYWPSKVTYEKWSRKSNPEFPSPEKVRDEIVQMLKGVVCAGGKGK
jgi:hypothetical protein